jgi:Ca2+/Na+ antiporter
MDIIAGIRDILISIYLLVGIVLVLAMVVFMFLLYKVTKDLLRTATRTTANFEKISASAVEHISKPLEEGVSLGSVAGNMFGFAAGFIAGMRGRKANKEDSDTVNRLRRWIPFL